MTGLPSPADEAAAQAAGRAATAQLAALLKPFVDLDVVDREEARRVCKREGLRAYDLALAEGVQSAKP